MQKLLRTFPLHSFLLAAFPIVSLLAANIDQVYVSDSLKSLLISLSVAALALLVLRILVKNWQLAGVLVSLLAAWFFLYGRIYVPLKSIEFLGLIVGRHRYVLVAWTGLILVAAVWVIRRSRVHQHLTLGLNMFSTILILLPTLQIGAFLLRNRKLPDSPEVSSKTSLLSWTKTSDPPDIYYILLDGYVRDDVLKQVYDLDNSPFLDELRQMGFYVAECSRSNYSRTAHSLTSTFNMEFVQTLDPDVAPDANPDWLLPYLKHNPVRQQLEGLGYKTIVFEHAWKRYVWDDADIVFKASNAALLSPFEDLLLRTTVARVYLDVLEAQTSQLSDYTSYENTRFALKELPRIPEIDGPKLVFAHLIIPHSPFVFGPNGEKIDIPYDADAGNIYTEEDDHRGYVAAVTYIDKMMLEIIPQLIHDSKTPPIIIVAGDHGTPWGGGLNEVKNLEAFYTPGIESPFYSTVTPVNIFPILFNSYFDGSFSLLPDTSYLFAGLGLRFQFREFPNSCDR